MLLIALWARSYWTCDCLGCSSAEIASGVGVIQFSALSSPQYDGWLYTNISTDDIPRDENTDLRMFAYHSDADLTYLNLPHWLLAFVLSTCAAVPWAFRRRFSLRTLLIVTTLVAAILGLIVWLSHK
jgi:hypothetical protein